MENYSVAKTDIMKLKTGGFHTLESVRKQNGTIDWVSCPNMLLYISYSLVRKCIQNKDAVT